MTHLSKEQIARWVAGERGAEAEVHIAGCDACREEVERFAGMLAQFRNSAESVPAPPYSLRGPRHAVWPRYLAVAAALVVLTSLPLYQRHRDRERAEMERQDALLLQQVDAGISRGVPDSMEPLVQMVSWNSGSTETNSTEGQK